MAEWKEIMRIRDDHGVMYVRIPRLWAKKWGLVRGSYVVMLENPAGGLEIRTFDAEVKNGKRADDGQGGRNR